MSLKILHLIDNLEPGGAQTRLLNDLRFINKDLFNNFVCCLFGQGVLIDKISTLGVKAINLRMNNIFDLDGWRRLFALIKKEKFDIIHTQVFFSDIMGRIIGRYCNVPSIVSSIQSSTYEPYNKYLYSGKRRIIDSLSGRYINDHFIAVSEFVKSSCIKRLNFNENKISVIPNYVDPEYINDFSKDKLNNIRQELNIKPDDLIFICVGRINPAKGQRYILQAMPEIKKIHPYFKLLLVGDGPDKEFLKKMSFELNLDKNIDFLGERNDVRELLQLSEAFILLTESEGLSLAVLEAMSVGKTCIVSNILPNKELIVSMSTGILVDRNDKMQLIDAINLIVKNRELRNLMGSAAKSEVKKRFSPGVNIKKLEELYLGLPKRS